FRMEVSVAWSLLLALSLEGTVLLGSPYVGAGSPDALHTFPVRQMVGDARRSSIGQAGEFQQRIHILEDFDGIPCKTRAQRSAGLHLFPHDPRLNLLPVLWLRGPTLMLGPLALLRGIPVALIFPAQALFLLCDPSRVGQHARLRNQRQRRLFPFCARVNAKAGCDHLRRKPHVKLAILPIPR